MGTKLPGTAAADDYAGDDYAVQQWEMEKEGWQRERAIDGNKTADVIRATESGGDPVAALQPTYTAVSGLSGLGVLADAEVKRYERKFGGLIEEADRVFIFYDVTGAIVTTDLIEFEDDLYEVMQVEFEPQSGRTEVLAKLNRSDV